MFLGKKITESKFRNRTLDFARIAELKNANEKIAKNICKIEENKIVALN